MIDLNQILHNITNNSLMPVIQRSDGLYTISLNVWPSGVLGTNLIANYINDNIPITINGTWDTAYYSYNEDTGKWEYLSIK